MLTAVLAVRNETPSGPAREVSNGAIIFRAGDKHYLVDANPPRRAIAFPDAFGAMLDRGMVATGGRAPAVGER
jgi:hypothetical protein